MSNNVVSLQINTADIMAMNRVDRIVLDLIRTYACTRTARTGVRVTFALRRSSFHAHWMLCFASLMVVFSDIITSCFITCFTSCVSKHVFRDHFHQPVFPLRVRSQQVASFTPQSDSQPQDEWELYSVSNLFIRPFHKVIGSEP